MINELSLDRSKMSLLSDEETMNIDGGWLPIVIGIVSFAAGVYWAYKIDQDSEADAVSAVQSSVTSVTYSVYSPCVPVTNSVYGQ